MPNDAGTTTIMVPTGALGAGLRKEHVERGIRAGAVAIAVDAGSTDSGPAYLAKGVAKWPREAVKRDLEILMKARERAGIPLLIGSCGTSGCDAAVDWTLEIVIEVAREHDLRPRIALLYSEQDCSVVKEKLRQGRVRPLPPSADLDERDLDACNHVVAMMGIEPYIAAIEGGADIILGGRTTDTALIAAVPVMRGMGAGAAWHAAKTAECGGVCTVRRGEGGVLVRVSADSFEIEPLIADNRCTVQSVAAHMLYENSDPYVLHEPGGMLDVTDAHYMQVDDRTVRVTGSRFEPRPYTMKLEGAGGGPYQTMSIVGIEESEVLAELDLFHDRLLVALHERVHRTFGQEAGEYDLSVRIYGWNAMSGRARPPGSAVPLEVGVMLVVTAATQSLATRISKICNPLLFHFPLSPDRPMPSYGFAFTPAETERGQVYRFYLNHVVQVDDSCELVRTHWVQSMGSDNAKAA